MVFDFEDERLALVKLARPVCRVVEVEDRLVGDQLPLVEHFGDGELDAIRRRRPCLRVLVALDRLRRADVVLQAGVEDALRDGDLPVVRLSAGLRRDDLLDQRALLVGYVEERDRLRRFRGLS